MNNINREFITINKYTIVSLLWRNTCHIINVKSIRTYNLASNTNLLHREINITNEDYKLPLISNIISTQMESNTIKHI